MSATRARHLAPLLACLAFAVSVPAGAAKPVAAGKPQVSDVSSPAAVRRLAIANKPWSGDFDAMLARRMVRIYAPFSRTLYYNDGGRERGLAAELARDWERYLNAKYAKQLGKRPLTVYIAPARRDRLLALVNEGLADVAVGNLTMTPARLEQVDFVGGGSTWRAVDEVIVTGPRSPAVASLDDLAGQRVHVRRSSSYFESLESLNERLRGDGKAEVRIVEVPDALEDEDLMDMENIGLVELVVVDEWKARMWQQVAPKLTVRDDLVLRGNARTGWAIRKGSPALAAEIDDFFANWAMRLHVTEYRMNAYMKRARQLKDPTATAEYRRFRQTLALFEKYGERYRFDPLMLAAQGYQESQLDQGAKSAVGAIGIMQLMPATGAEMAVGDIHKAEANIHAGTKYMDQLMTRFFPDAAFREGNRPLFAFASYNCGPGNVARARKEAKRRGLDPDKWFENVEVIVAQQIGIETTTYVRNIYKYYVAYKLTLAAEAEAEAARRELAPAPR